MTAASELTEKLIEKLTQCEAQYQTLCEQVHEITRIGRQLREAAGTLRGQLACIKRTETACPRNQP